MLIDIPKELSPDLLKILAEMGHGDYVVVADEFYPAVSKNDSKRVIYTKGLSADVIINALLKVLPIDVEFCDNPVQYMVPDDDINFKSNIHKKIKELLIENDYKAEIFKPLARKDFYEKAKSAYATISTSEMNEYGCFILQKGTK